VAVDSDDDEDRVNQQDAKSNVESQKKIESA
jgi:hypothetical protein